MTKKELVLTTMKQFGKAKAQDLQNRVPEMTGTEIYAEKGFIPKFDPTKQYMNYPVGYVCKSPAGRLVKLLQAYDSTVYTQDPEELVAQWGFYWSKDPKDALPYIALSTSPYGKGDCCSVDGVVYRSTMDNNVWSPVDYPQGWEEVTE